MVGPREALTVDSLVGPRWALALALLESGEAPIGLGHVLLSRSISGPVADGRIRVTVEVAERISEDAARQVLREAHETVAAAASGDETFARLVAEHAPRWELVYDYGMGTVLVACEEDDGTVVWPQE